MGSLLYDARYARLLGGDASDAPQVLRHAARSAFSTGEFSLGPLWLADGRESRLSECQLLREIRPRHIERPVLFASRAEQLLDGNLCHTRVAVFLSRFWNWLGYWRDRHGRRAIWAVRTVLTWHVTWSINSVTHIWGYQNYDTRESSRNNILVGLWSNGEGWHNNHHADQRAASHGHKWWEFDLTWLTVRFLEMTGLAKDVVRPKVWEKKTDA